MLENIKSSFFIKLLFSYINEETKLKIVKYNKIFQKRINVDITNYKLFSGRYIVYEEKDKVKEYDIFDNKLRL